MPRFFADKENISEGRILITGPDVNHIKNVLRRSEGDEISVSDGEGTDYFGHIGEISSDAIEVIIDNSWASYTELESKVYLFQGLPKGPKLETIIQKSVELGVYEIVPILTERCIAKIDKDNPKKKLARWNQISEAAAKQAGRGLIPEVKEAMSFKAALEYASKLDIRLIPYEKAEGMDAARELIRSIEPGQSVGVFIGPEGGFSEQEIALAEKAGVKPMSLGRRILRTETAGPAVLSVIMFSTDK